MTFGRIDGRTLIKQHSLPYDAEIEYLELTGGQYINSGETISDALGYSIDFSDTPYNVWVCGGRAAYMNGGVGLYRVSANDIQFSFGNTFHSRAYGTLRHVVKFQDRSCYIDSDLSYTFTPSTFSNTLLFYIGNLCINTDGTPSNVGMQGKLYGAQVFIGNQVVHDFTPVRVGSVGYMYDKVSKQLFGNQGTGDFVLPPASSGGGL